MAVRLRLRRTGKRGAASHRIVAADIRSPRDGRFIENLGFYDPRRKVEKIDLERVAHWLSHGAQPSDTVAAIIKRARAGMSLGGPEAVAKSAEEAEEAPPAQPVEQPVEASSEDEAPASKDDAPAEPEG